MDYEIKDGIHKEIARHIKEDRCPSCKADVTFICVAFWPDEGDNHEYWRCMKCLDLFEQNMTKV